MSHFDPVFDDLPATLPIFPLTGVLLLPRGMLPLNIFEPRYLNMIQDALGADRMIGMIQPSSPGDAGEPPVYGVGCAGRIVQFEETDDGRFLLSLPGVCRFKVEQEIPTTRGYRRIRPNWDDHGGDLSGDEGGLVDRESLFTGLQSYFKNQGIEASWKALRETPDERLINSLAMICPFEPPEKQALLEAKTLSDRASILTALVEMAVLDTGGDGSEKSKQ